MPNPNVPNAVAGAYTATFNGLALGQTAQGYRLSHTHFKRPVTGDALAQSPQTAVFQGIEMFLQANLIEFNAAGIYPLIWPYGSTYLQFGPVGRMDVESSLTKQMILTAVTGTPAQVLAAPASLTLPNAILAEGFPVELLLAPDLREVPMRMRLYPTTTGSPYAGASFGTKT